MLTFEFAAYSDEKNVGTASEEKRAKQVAMTLMQDIVPHPPFSDEMVKVSSERARAIWGKFFGDDQVGALVAVKSENTKANNGMLCLLLWQNGWKFAQMAGMVSWPPAPDRDWDWKLAQRNDGEPYYVLSRSYYGIVTPEEQLSWLCDPKAHSLTPTGWPKNAFPSLSDNTITFRYRNQDLEIDEFDGKPGRNLVTYNDNLVFNGEPIRISMPDPVTAKRITWRILPAKSEAGHERLSLCYSTSEGKLEPFHEDATLDVQWEEGRLATEAFLIWRSSGVIDGDALYGIWGDKVGAQPKPVRVVVTGIPEAVKAFSWPLNPGTPSPATPAPEPK